MKRAWLLVVLVLSMAAAPASASTTVGWGVYTFPPIWGSYMRHIVVRGSDGANHDIVVKPTGAQQLGGFPQKVEIYDYGDTFEPPASGQPCFIDSPHHVTCAASGPPTVAGDPYSYVSYAEVIVDTGNGNDSVEISDPLNPMFAAVHTFGGDDNVSISGMWSSGGGKYGNSDALGAGNDVAELGQAPLWEPPLRGLAGGTVGVEGGRLLSTDTGDDTVHSLNGAVDHISCGDGNDAWVSDPFDDQQTFAYAGPPDTNGDCEQHTPPTSP